ncbi:O-antigen translocase [Winogradskyella flava]|uniref:O-antigen translocase n=1 Tax=Winogradskyella flava TaxID=1884876 RepID=A0A842ITV1_9FLAO|nr:O-antigen translocase [Winogradskyella flava]MBC2844827.1 O-antigen translocase [Winogradskyella flava]
MKKFFNYINSEVLIKAASLNTANISVKIIAGIIISKCIAVFIGPEGMALIGNLRNFLSAIQSVAIAGLYDGVVKFISRTKTNIDKLTNTLSTVFYFGFFSSVFLAFVCFYNAQYINELIFLNNDYEYIIKVLAIVLPFYALNMFLFCIMNGFSKYRILLVINIIGQVLGLLVTILLIWQNKIDGALLAIVITPALSLLITFVGIVFRKNLAPYIKITSIDFSVLKQLSPNMIMALVSSIAIPVVLIIIRNYIIDEIGIKEAGYWEAVNRVSDYYLMFIYSLMALYILPRFTQIDSKKEFRKEVFSFYKTVLPIFALILLIVYLTRSFLVTILFTEEFRPIEDLFGYQILGDFMRVMSMVIAYQFLAKKMFAHFIIIEIFLFVIMYVSSIYLIDIFGLKGAVMGHCLSYLMHFGIILLIFGSSLFGVLNEEGIDDY